MLTLVVHTDSEPLGKTRLVLRQVETWLAARGVAYRVLAVDSPELSSVAIEARAIVGVGSRADGGMAALTGFFRRLPEDRSASKSFLWIKTVAPAAESNLGRFWLALQRVGIAVLLKPVLLEGWSEGGDALSDRDSRRLSDGLVALVESLDFCRRLDRKLASIDLAERFAHAPLLA